MQMGGFKKISWNAHYKIGKRASKFIWSGSSRQCSFCCITMFAKSWTHSDAHRLRFTQRGII